MRTEDLYSSAVPMVVKLDIGMTEPEGVALEITYAQTRERFEAGQFNRAMYVMTIPMANELLSILQTEMTGKALRNTRHRVFCGFFSLLPCGVYWPWSYAAADSLPQRQPRARTGKIVLQHNPPERWGNRPASSGRAAPITIDLLVAP